MAFYNHKTVTNIVVKTLEKKMGTTFASIETGLSEAQKQNWEEWAGRL